MDTIELVRQTREVITVEYLDGDTPVNLTGYTAKAQMRNKTTKAVAISLDSTAPGDSGIFITPLDGKLDVVFSTDDMNTTPAGLYDFDVALITGGEVTRPVRLVINLVDYVTDAV